MEVLILNPGFLITQDLASVIMIYNIYLYPLANYPGPLLARSSLVSDSNPSGETAPDCP